MKIPKQIQIAGREIPIIFNNKLCDVKRIYAEADYRKHHIIIQDNTEGTPRNKDCINISLLHEIMHWIFYLMDRDKLRDDEKLVSEISELLYQVIKQIENKD